MALARSRFWAASSDGLLSGRSRQAALKAGRRSASRPTAAAALTYRAAERSFTYFFLAIAR